MELVVALAAGVAASALLGFGWWFGLMKRNDALPILNAIIPPFCLAGAPAVLCVWLSRVRTVIAYVIGSWSFVGWALMAIAIDQLQQGVSWGGLNIDVGTTLKVGLPISIGITVVGLGVGVVMRRMLHHGRRMP